MISKALGWHDDDIKSIKLEVNDNNMLTVILTDNKNKELKNSIILPAAATGGGDISAAADNTFTGINVFSGAVTQVKNYLDVYSNETDVGHTYYGIGQITRWGTDGQAKTINLPDEAGTLALTSNIVEFKENNLISGYKCSLTREVTQWLNGSYGSYCCPGYLVAGFGSGSASKSTSSVAIGPDGLYKLTSSSSKRKYTLPDLDVESTTIATLNSENIFRKALTCIITNDSVNYISELNESGLRIGEGPSGSSSPIYYTSYKHNSISVFPDVSGEYSLSFPGKAGTLALTSDIPQMSFDESTGTLSITLS